MQGHVSIETVLITLSICCPQLPWRIQGRSKPLSGVSVRRHCQIQQLLPTFIIGGRKWENSLMEFLEEYETEWWIPLPAQSVLGPELQCLLFKEGNVIHLTNLLGAEASPDAPLLHGRWGQWAHLAFQVPLQRQRWALRGLTPVDFFLVSTCCWKTTALEAH